jgi:hypothetical protein
MGGELAGDALPTNRARESVRGGCGGTNICGEDEGLVSKERSVGISVLFGM